MNEVTRQEFETLKIDVEKLKEQNSDVREWQGTYGEKIRNIEKYIEEIRSTVSELKSRPVAYWNTVVISLITGVMGAAIGAITAALFG